MVEGEQIKEIKFKAFDVYAGRYLTNEDDIEFNVDASGNGILYVHPKGDLGDIEFEIINVEE